MKKFLRFSFVTLAIFSLFLSQPAFAADIKIPFDSTQVGHLPNVTALPEDIIAHPDTPEGILAYKNLLNWSGGYLNLVIPTVALFMLFIAGYQLVTAQQAASEEMQKQKLNIMYILLGLIGFGLSADFVYNYLYKESGDFLLQKETAEAVAKASVARLKDLLDLFLSFAGVGAILMMVISGIRLILTASEEEIQKQKKTVAYIAIGIVIIGMANTLVNGIFFPEGGFMAMNVEVFNIQLAGLQNYILGFLGAVALATFVLGGFVYVINFGNEEMTAKVKKAMYGVLIGVTIVFSAYTIVATAVNTFLAVEGGVPKI